MDLPSVRHLSIVGKHAADYPVSLSLSLTIITIYRRSFFFFLTTNKAIDFVIFPFKLYRQKVSKLNLVLPSKQEESESSGCTFVTIDSSNRRLILRV